MNTIKRYLCKPELANWSLTSVYFQMLRDKAAFMSRATWYKYVRLTDIERFTTSTRKNKNRIGIRAARPLELLHMDLTLFKPLDHTRVYLYFIVDNFSRAILGWKASLKYASEITMQNLKEVCMKYRLYNTQASLMVDDGSENKGSVNEFLSIPEVEIRKLIAQKDIFFSNSMVEAVNKRIKYDFLFTRELLNFDQTFAFLEEAIPQYNSKPHYALHGLTPVEVLEGKVPDKTLFSNDIVKAKAIRKIENLKYDCAPCIIPK